VQQDIHFTLYNAIALGKVTGEVDVLLHRRIDNVEVHIRFHWWVIIEGDSRITVSDQGVVIEWVVKRGFFSGDRMPAWVTLLTISYSRTN
jgi:hypothetical protein